MTVFVNKINRVYINIELFFTFQTHVAKPGRFRYRGWTGRCLNTWIWVDAFVYQVLTIYLKQHSSWKKCVFYVIGTMFIVALNHCISISDLNLRTLIICLVHIIKIGKLMDAMELLKRCSMKIKVCHYSWFRYISRASSSVIMETSLRNSALIYLASLLHVCLLCIPLCVQIKLNCLRFMFDSRKLNAQKL